MKFNTFQQLPKESTFVGGKAYVLAMLSQAGLPVPDGSILSTKPIIEEDWDEIKSWWLGLGSPMLAIRSSALGEDSSEYSFAGQNSTFLNVIEWSEIKSSIFRCFDSVNKKSSQVYREFFTGEKKESQMNVVLQVMITPLYSGVFFSIDPRSEEDGWLLEYIEGLGEDLVSGKKTPFQVKPNVKLELKGDKWREEFSIFACEFGDKAKALLNNEVDMEFCVDDKGTFYVLQARPITAGKSQSQLKKIALEELKKLKSVNDKDTAWDGKTFSEWTGYPSHLTFSIWRRAFSPHYAFGDSLEKLGYKSFKKEQFLQDDSLLERVFGRAYVNLGKMEPLYFGEIPYSIVPKPRPHLKFTPSKINLKVILKTPLSIFRMLSVGWSLSTCRKEWMNECSKELLLFKHKMVRPLNSKLYEGWDIEHLRNRLLKEGENFSKFSLFWPFILIVLVESTMQSFLAILKNVLGEKKSGEALRRWMAQGVNTATAEMNEYFTKACEKEHKREFFMGRYGHRGPGELDLANPRWVELGNKAFFKYSEHKSKKVDSCVVEDEINNLKTFKKAVILQEWRLLKSMLELREKWKMELLRPYSHIRFIALELGKRSGLENDIFWLELEEIARLDFSNLDDIKVIIDERKKRAKALKTFSFPEVVTLQEIEDVIRGRGNVESSTKGEAISSGVVKGEVRVVRDITNVDVDSWPSNTILVAEATDPGWTPLFTKAKGIIVEKGGVLSHCAIVAREMNVPAVSGIRHCHNNLKDGDIVWVDGNNGTINVE